MTTRRRGSNVAPVGTARAGRAIGPDQAPIRGAARGRPAILEGRLVDEEPVRKSISESGVPDNSSLSPFSARTRPSWLNRSVRDHAVASSSWRRVDGLEATIQQSRTLRDNLICALLTCDPIAAPAHFSSRSKTRPARCSRSSRSQRYLWRRRRAAESGIGP